MGVSFGDRPHERRLTPNTLLLVHACAVVKQFSYGVHAARPRAGHQRRDAGRKGVIGVCVTVEQSLDHSGAAIDTCQGERRDPKLVSSR